MPVFSEISLGEAPSLSSGRPADIAAFFAKRKTRIFPALVSFAKLGRRTTSPVSGDSLTNGAKTSARRSRFSSSFRTNSFARGSSLIYPTPTVRSLLDCFPDSQERVSWNGVLSPYRTQESFSHQANESRFGCTVLDPRRRGHLLWGRSGAF